MDVGTISIFLVVSVLATNQLIMRLRAFHSHAGVFWSLEALNVIFAAYVLWFGLPGLRDRPVVGVVIGLLVMLHTAQNLQVRQLQVQAMAEEERADRIAERAEEIRAKLED